MQIGNRLLPALPVAVGVLAGSIVGCSDPTPPRVSDAGWIYVLYTAGTGNIAEPNALWRIRPDGSDRQRVPCPGYCVYAAPSRDGGRIAVGTDTPPSGAIHILDTSGVELGTPVSDSVSKDYLEWSPTGTQLTYAGSAHVWTADLGAGVSGQFQRDGAYTSQPTWAPDGRRIAASRSGKLVVFAASGASVDTVAGVGVGSNPDINARYPAWSPTGERIAFICEPASAGVAYFERICLVNSDGAGFRFVTPDGELADQPAWSPDGGRIVYRRSPPGGAPAVRIGVIDTVAGAAPRSILQPPGSALTSVRFAWVR